MTEKPSPEFYEKTMQAIRKTEKSEKRRQAAVQISAASFLLLLVAGLFQFSSRNEQRVDSKASIHRPSEETASFALDWKWEERLDRRRALFQEKQQSFFQSAQKAVTSPIRLLPKLPQMPAEKEGSIKSSKNQQT